MPFLDHVEELRWRILKSLVAVLVASLVGWVIVEHVDVIRMLMRPIIPLLPDGKLKFTSPTEPFLITLKFAFALGLVIASPVVIYQVWAFLTPALYDREKRLIVPALSVGVVLFLTGAAVAYEWLLPRVLRMLFSFQPQVFSPIITADGYFSFAAQFLIAIGLAMELPLVVVILTALGLATPQFLARNRRYALAVSAVDAGRDRPPDGALRGEHLVLVGRDQTPGPSREGRPGERRRARCPAAGCRRHTRRPDPEAAPSASSTARHDGPDRGGLGRPGAPRYRDRSPARPADGPDPQLPTVRRGDRLAAQAEGVPHHRVHGGHVDRPRWRYPDDAPARRGVRRARRHEGRIGLDPLPPAELSAGCDRRSPLVRSGDGHGGGIDAVRYLSQARYRAQCPHQLPAGHRLLFRDTPPRGRFGLHAPVRGEQSGHHRREPGSRLPLRHRRDEVAEQKRDGGPAGRAVHPRRPDHVAAVHFSGRAQGTAQRHSGAALRLERHRSPGSQLRAPCAERGILLGDQRLLRFPR